MDERVALPLRVLPLLVDEPEFALQRGTAIDLVHCAVPRRSVDLGPTSVPDRSPSPRDEDALVAEAGGHLEFAAERLEVRTEGLQLDVVDGAPLDARHA